ncbi:PRC-barrel domain-containing protein [Motilibacter aurantiacus]|uniref:PRC-barrel domain-containing protein n=1 Tax=Motilibacter aurantiacus TaxID=2714955 RepID=UPI00140C445E|nr:PRC-barrel domain-containing protein [Motilibacter aurantiacus]NHC46124.1 hypothetical protein [Motilibacter aurantiacus]
MADSELIQRLSGVEVHGNDGTLVGRVAEVYLDDETGVPAFVTVNRGQLSSKQAFVPLAGAREDKHGLVVPWPADQVKGAPDVSASGGGITPGQRDELLSYYDVSREDLGRGPQLPLKAGDLTGAHGGEVTIGTGPGGTRTGTAGFNSAAGTDSLRERGTDAGDSYDSKDYFVVSDTGEHFPVDVSEVGEGGQPVVDLSSRERLREQP